MRLSATLLFLAIGAAAAWAQVAPPHVGCVYPAGGRQGGTCEIKVAGEHLEGAVSLHVSGDGVEGKILSHTRPLNQKELAALRKMLQDLEKKETKTESDRKEISEIRKKLAPPAVRPTPVLAEIVTIEVTIAPKAAPGPRQLRLRANTGMSNPIVFVVGQLPEVSQKKELVDGEVSRPQYPDINVTLPAVLNSQIMPGTVDRYRFEARKGQQLVFIAHARDLIPYLADAVPGWFQAALTLYDHDGNEVAYADHFHHQPDPVLAYKVPRDGEYVLEMKDALYRGREDFVYRIEAGELPFIRSIFPLGGQAKTRTVVALEGWNLPENKLVLEPVVMKPGMLSLSIPKGDVQSNSVLFAVDGLPETMKQEPCDTKAAAQPITLPIFVNGRIERAGSWDVYRFEGRSGQVVIAEVRARRLGSPLDSVLKLTDSNGKVIAYNDDWEDRGQGLITHHADSMFRAVLPTSGTYYLYLGDAQGQASPAHAYRLRVSAPHPDFELRVNPCSINARPGSTVPITVSALRKDGFTGEINLGLTYLPVDFSLGGAKVPANQDVVRLTLQVPTTVRPRPIDLVLEGSAVIEGKKIVRIATPAEDMTQAFAYHHLVPARDLMVTVDGKARARFPATLLDKGPIRIPAGGTALVHLAIPRPPTAAKIHLLLNDPPDGITLKDSQVNNNGAVLLLQADGEKVTPGLRGNLIVEAYPDPGTKTGARAAQPIGTLPAIPFEVLKVRR
jgi:hypothetical protein